MAITRDAAAKAQIKLRLKEPLRARLAAEAKRNEVSLNTEIIQRLQTSLNEEEQEGFFVRLRACPGGQELRAAVQGDDWCGREHVASPDCWCGPTPDPVVPDVFIHRDSC